MIVIPNSIDEKHASEIKRFATDGFCSGFSYKNGKDQQRMVLHINYPVGCVIDGGVSYREHGDTKITFVGEHGESNCTIAQWYNWIGETWSDGDSVQVADDPLQKQAVLLSKGKKTIPFEGKTESKDHNWQSHSQKEKKKPS